MKADEAKSIVALLKAATRGTQDENKLAFFEGQMGRLQYRYALDAAHAIAASSDFFPSWAEFKMAYRLQERLSQPAPIAPVPVVSEPPEWIWVWRFARYVRSPRDMRMFPQENGDPTRTMTVERYEELRQEWITAGSPRGSLSMMGVKT